MAGLPVIRSPRSRADPLKTLGDIADGSGRGVAEKWDRAIWERPELIAEHPDIGAMRPRLGESVRIGVVKPYIIFYSHDGAAIRVMRILHGRRRITRKMISDGG